jgi:hypothetical protein
MILPAGKYVPPDFKKCGSPPIKSRQLTQKRKAKKIRARARRFRCWHLTDSPGTKAGAGLTALEAMINFLLAEEIYERRTLLWTS